MYASTFMEGFNGRGRVEHCNSGGAHTQMVFVEDLENFEREGTAELKNDPRFFTENVIDKRLMAFEALAIVTELVSEQAVKQCFELSHDYSWTGKMIHVSIMQLVGFFVMVAVMFLATVATAVLSLQLFFAIRLMTAGPTGFDKAARFYQDNRMWVWRERAIFGVKWSLVLFLVSTGFMLYVKFYTEGAVITEEEKEEEYFDIHRSLAAAVLAVFLVLTAMLVRLMRVHQRVFDESYVSIDTCSNELNRHLVSHR
mmetsp:Transcript_42520/g.123598  ORF Transcript_42520/g.123598 Transcript_42520/m.123598 type:complete len:255 (-) Transcript_42520:115-879(-)